MVDEKTISSDKIYTGKTISVKVDTVEVENKGYQKREIVEHPGAVGVVAINEDKEIILVKQFRKPIEEEIWELPGGKLEPGENPKECAIRELREETGYECNNLKLINKFFTSAGFSNQKLYIYVSTDIVLNEENKCNDENLEVFKLPLTEVYDMISRNEIKDAKTIIGILLSKELI